MKRRRRPAGPPAWQAHVLDAVASLTAQGQQASAHAVAERLGITRQCASRQLHALEAKGLLRDKLVMVRSGNWETVT